MKTRKKLSFELDVLIDRFNKFKASTDKKIFELENPVLIEPFNEVKVHFEKCIDLDGYIEIEQPEMIGTAKILSVETEIIDHIHYRTFLDRMYDILITNEQGETIRTLVGQNRLKKAIEKAK